LDLLRLHFAFLKNFIVEAAMVLLKGWKYVAFVGTFVGAFGLAIYPIIISPMLDSSPWSKLIFINLV